MKRRTRRNRAQAILIALTLVTLAAPMSAANDSFSDGTYIVGADIAPETYRSTGIADLCYWERLSDFSGEFGAIIANGNESPEIVTIEATDAGFRTQDCGEWVPVEKTLPDVPASRFSDGTYVVSGHIEPGTYRADGGAGDSCYWERLENFTQQFGSIIANGNSPTIVTIMDTDAGFTSFGCGTWTKI